MATWGIAVWGDGRAPSAFVEDNVIFRTGACGILVDVAQPKGGSAPREGAISRNALVETVQDERYDDGDLYCPQQPIARVSVPDTWPVTDNLFHANRRPAHPMTMSWTWRLSSPGPCASTRSRSSPRRQRPRRSSCRRTRRPSGRPSGRLVDRTVSFQLGNAMKLVVFDIDDTLTQTCGRRYGVLPAHRRRGSGSGHVATPVERLPPRDRHRSTGRPLPQGPVEPLPRMKNTTGSWTDSSRSLEAEHGRFPDRFRPVPRCGPGPWPFWGVLKPGR